MPKNNGMIAFKVISIARFIFKVKNDDNMIIFYVQNFIVQLFLGQTYKWHNNF